MVLRIIESGASEEQGRVLQIVSHWKYKRSDPMQRPKVSRGIHRKGGIRVKKGRMTFNIPTAFQT